MTVTIAPDLSGFAEAMERAGRSIRVVSLRIQRKHALADVVEHQEGRQIVREGMADVLAWMGEGR